MDDERLNLPSASGIERLSLCPASRTMELSIPDERTAESKSGDAAHDLAAKYFSFLAAADQTGNLPAYFPWPPMPQEMYAGLDINLADVVERFIDMAQSVFSNWIAGLPEDHATPTLYVEVRLVWTGAKFKPVTTGKPDVVWVSGKYALVLDLKSLNGEQTESVKNLQLRTYAILVNEEHGCTEIVVVICQPRVSSQPQTCIYQDEIIHAAKEEILFYLAESEKQDAALVAGIKQCKFCRARAVCAAAGDFAVMPDKVPMRELAKGEPARIVALLTVKQRIDIWERSKTVERILKAVKDNLLELPAAELAEHGLEVLTQRGDREIKDGPAAWEAVKDVVTPEAWNGCCTVGISKLENAFRAATHLPVKETKEQLEAMLTKHEKKPGDILDRKKESKVLSRIKPGTAPKQATLELNAPAAS